MLNLLTAVPGSGKTLYAIKRIAEDANRDNRQVYYSGIPLTDKGKEQLGWIELEDPAKWYELPPGAVIVIDECQRIFPPRRNGTEIPKHVSMFETHRHHGFDVWLITQSPKLLDTHVREIVNKHYHLRRVFGSQSARLYQWDCCELQPNSRGAASRSPDVRLFAYPKAIYPLYKSAELHTHKLQIPKKAIQLIALTIALPCIVWFAVHALGRLGKQPATPSAAASAPAAQAPSANAPRHAPRTASEVHVERAALVAEYPETAPVYEEIAKPKTFPRLAGCVQSAKRCTCYTQQGTTLDVPANVCGDVVANGRFDPYRNEETYTEKTATTVTAPVTQHQEAPQVSINTLPDATGGLQLPPAREAKRS